jgi:hypothetical protein
MKYRIGGWALAGVVIATSWAIYLLPTFHMAMSRDIMMLARVTCPIALVGEHYHRGIALAWVLISNAIVYGLLGMSFEPLLRLAPRLKLA